MTNPQCSILSVHGLTRRTFPSLRTLNLQPSTFNLQPLTWEQAESLATKSKDVHHPAAWFIQSWLDDLLDRAIAQYAECKNPKDRSLQRGEAWLSFQNLFKDILRKRGHQSLLWHLYRFALSDDSPANFLHRALTPLTLERHHTLAILSPATLAYFYRPPRGPEWDSAVSRILNLPPAASQPALPSGSNSGHSTINPQPSTIPDGLPPIITATQYSQAVHSPLHDPAVLNLASKTTIIRWCAWLDSAIHLRVHYMWHAHPECFELDPERRELACLGHGQRILPNLDPHAKACWSADFNRAAEKYKNSPKWSQLGKAMSSHTPRAWAYPHLDAHIISLWPLVNHFNWTYRDLLHVIRSVNSEHPAAFHRYPCDRDQDFASYCTTALGLRKTRKGQTPKDALPEGHEIATNLYLSPKPS